MAEIVYSIAELYNFTCNSIRCTKIIKNQKNQFFFKKVNSTCRFGCALFVFAYPKRKRELFLQKFFRDENIQKKLVAIERQVSSTVKQVR